MIELRRAWILFKNNLPFQYRSKAILWIIAYGILLTFLTTWNIEQGMVNLATFTVGELGEERIYALQDAFYDYVFVLYIPVILFYIRTQVLGPIAQSYTVSNSLWLRLAPTKPISLALHRSFIVIGGTFFLTVTCFFWASLFSLWHNIPLRLLFQSIYSLTGYTLLTGGIIIIFKGRPTQSLEMRQAYVWMVILVPFILYFFKDIGSRNFGSFYPFVAPYLKHVIGKTTLHGTTAAAILGLLLMSLNVAYTGIRFPNTSNQLT